MASLLFAHGNLKFEAYNWKLLDININLNKVLWL